MRDYPKTLSLKPDVLLPIDPMEPGPVDMGEVPVVPYEGYGVLIGEGE